MAKLVTFKSHRVNVLNLVPYHLCESYMDQWYGACRSHIDPDTGYMYSTPDGLEKETVGSVGSSLRDVKWDQHVDYLEEIANSADTSGRSLFFGTHSENQLDFLTDFFAHNVLTFSLSYTSNDYDQLLENLASRHVHLLVTQQIEPNQIDQEKIKLPKVDAVEFYKQEFDRLKLIPESYSDDRYYQIPYMDYLKPNVMYQHFSNLGFDSNHGFYDQWLSCQ